MAETDRENIREATLEGLNAASRKGKHGGRPPVITDDMLLTVLRRANGGAVEDECRPAPGSRLRNAHRFHPSWSMAQSLIISTGFQGGSQMICTSTSVTPGTSAKVLLIESVM